MDYTTWNALLFILKWVFIGLVFLMLSVVLVAVRRELAMRSTGEAGASAVSPGSLRVVFPGGDPRLQPGRSFNLKVNTTIGSDRRNYIVVRDNYTSKHHARLRWDGDAWWVEDLGSRNGTFVNRERIAADTPVRLAHGSALKLGEVIFEMVAED
jgi:hypothetical protein